MKDETQCLNDPRVSPFEKQLLKRLEEQEKINRRMLQSLIQLTTDVGRYVDAVLEAEKS